MSTERSKQMREQSKMFIILTGIPANGFSAYGPWETTEAAQTEAADAGEYLIPDNWWVLPVTANGDARTAADWRKVISAYLRITGDLVEGLEFSGPYEGKAGEGDGVTTLELNTAWC